MWLQHHVSSIVGKNSDMREMDKDEADAAGLRGHLLSGGQRVWVPVEHTPSASGNPTSALFDDGNGGEYRKTFHGYASPFAQIVESPKTVHGTAMQIDTWNRREMKLPSKPGEKPPKFVPGPHPRRSLAPTEGPDAICKNDPRCCCHATKEMINPVHCTSMSSLWLRTHRGIAFVDSGLLECPLTTRVKVEPNPGSEDFGPGSVPFGQGSGYYNYTSNCTVPTSVPGGQKTGTCHQVHAPKSMQQIQTILCT